MFAAVSILLATSSSQKSMFVESGGLFCTTAA